MPAPDRTATLMLLLTKQQEMNYKVSVDMRTGIASRKLAAEAEGVMKQADAARENVATELAPSCVYSCSEQLELVQYHIAAQD